MDNMYTNICSEKDCTELKVHDEKCAEHMDRGWLREETQGHEWGSEDDNINQKPVRKNELISDFPIIDDNDNIIWPPPHEDNNQKNP